HGYGSFGLHLHCHNTAIHWLPDHVCSYAGYLKTVGIDVPHPGVDKTRDDRDKNMSNTISGSDFVSFFR
ncbi:Innexin, partial [Caligus rogercresseyi]